MIKCVCPKDYLVAEEEKIRHDYVHLYPLSHSEACEQSMNQEITETKDNLLFNRLNWLTTKENSCDYPYSHNPHGACGGRSFDRT